MPTPKRSHFIDSMRGSAVLMMIAYHFCYDLDHFRFVQFNFHDGPFWLGFRTLIVSLFLLVVGISLALTHHRSIRWPSALKRLAVLAACSITISLVSYWQFPGRTIWFGILHFITLASLLAIPLIHYPRISLCVGVGLLVIGNSVSHPFFDQAWIHWLGMMTHKPFTEDYVPFLPWFGVVLCGLSIGHWLLTTRPGQFILYSNDRISTATLLTWPGRYSLWIYMLHQPFLFGLLWMVSTAFSA